MPAPPNPYFIYIELLWPDGHSANQNEIARVIAYDVNGAVVTNEGQSGYNPATGGWQPVFMQNIAAFYPPREKPNLKFEVVSTAEVSLYTTVVFNNIASGSTVRIIIGQSAVIVGGGTGPTTFTLTGHARRQSNSSPYSPGNVLVFDITNGSEALIGSTVLGAADGAYSLSFTSDQFTNNGVPHVQPNLQVRLYDPITGQFLTQSDLVVGWTSGTPIDLTVDDSVSPPQEHRVFGDVRNDLGLPVAAVLVQAFDVIWSTAGIQEILLGTTFSKADGSYEIVYQPPNPTTTPNACAPSTDQINLLVKAVTPALTSPITSPPTFTILASAGVFFNAAQEQRADLVVNKAAVSAASEYTQLHNAISACLAISAAISQASRRVEHGAGAEVSRQTVHLAALPAELGEVVEQRRRRADVVDDVNLVRRHIQRPQLPDHVAEIRRLIERDDVNRDGRHGDIRILLVPRHWGRARSDDGALFRFRIRERRGARPRCRPAGSNRRRSLRSWEPCRS